MAAKPAQRLAESGRVEAFSDGVFAVAITLLVLELQAPEHEGEFLQELLNEWQSYVAYLAAFLIIGVVWLTHHAMFSRVKFVDTRLMMQNLLQLLLTSLVPFAAAVVSSATRVGDKSDQLIAVLFFALVSTVLSLGWYSLTLYVERSPQLLIDAEDTSVIHAERLQQPIAFVPALLAAGVAFFEPVLGLAILGLSPIYYSVSAARADTKCRSSRAE